MKKALAKQLEICYYIYITNMELVKIYKEAFLMASVSLRNIYKKYPGGVIAVKDFNIEIKDKEFIILVGPSGCGKTTTLRVVGGFVEPKSGTVLFDGQDITDLPPYRRQVNTVFQRYALFPHLNVFENVAFGLRLKGMDEKEIRRLVLDMLEQEIAPLEIAQWNRPKGGYFVSFNAMPGTAKRTLQLCKEAGVVMTDAGATYPYGIDPADSNIRIAPSLPPVAELEQAMEVFTTCLKLAALEKLLEK